MVEKFTFGKPYETGAVIEKIQEGASLTFFEVKKMPAVFEFCCELSGDEPVYGLGQTMRGTNKRGARKNFRQAVFAVFPLDLYRRAPLRRKCGRATTARAGSTCGRKCASCPTSTRAGSYTADGRYGAETGTFDIMLGGSSESYLSAILELI